MPDDVPAVLEPQWGDLARHVSERLAVDGYRQGLLSMAPVRRLLGLATRWEAQKLPIPSSSIDFDERLDAGELAAIIDDREARNMRSGIGLPVTDTLGVLEGADEAGACTAQHRRDAKQSRVLRIWLDRFVLPEFAGSVLPVDTAVALRCARLYSTDRRPERDAWIAATAPVHAMAVVTRNAGDFETMGVPILNPWS